MSGSRLPGDSVSNDRHKSEYRVESRLKGDLETRAREYINDHGMNKSELVREALDEYLPAAETTPYAVPKDPKLADAYLALACGEKRVLSVEKAKTELANTAFPNTSKEQIEDGILRPLGDSDFPVTVKWGRLAVPSLTLKTEVHD
ncbi:hypothetical protein [Haloarcula montana]|uniref:hypothetical protein n=1 Tax=Haloarcula montana TaxID=3111776 RepID=UPI002D79B108|nr:hypothetical protein [Haloarcula sp. GH36]